MRSSLTLKTEISGVTVLTENRFGQQRLRATQRVREDVVDYFGFKDRTTFREKIGREHCFGSQNRATLREKDLEILPGGQNGCQQRRSRRVSCNI